jgi:hypothetical protein
VWEETGHLMFDHQHASPSRHVDGVNAPINYSFLKVLEISKLSVTSYCTRSRRRVVTSDSMSQTVWKSSHKQYGNQVTNSMEIKSQTVRKSSHKALLRLPDIHVCHIDSPRLCTFEPNILFEIWAMLATGNHLVIGHLATKATLKVYTWCQDTMLSASSSHEFQQAVRGFSLDHTACQGCATHTM